MRPGSLAPHRWPRSAADLARRAGLIAGIALVTAVALAPGAGADALSRVFINGRAYAASFNDGDSFRVQNGNLAGVQCRLSGFNTLESFGPAHQWGTWHPYELYVVAKQATYNGRRGVWHCFTDGNRDGYGRLLVECPDLIVSDLAAGYAHAYQPNDTPSRPEYIRTQQQAILNRRGIWAHGVPDFIMTSIHSADEDVGRELHYNRRISTRDGHTESIQHRETYRECEWVCDTENRADLQAITEAARRMRRDPQLAPLLVEWQNFHLIEFASRFVRNHELPEYLTPGPARAAIQQRLEGELSSGLLGTTRPERGSCMLHVPFDRRYGTSRAACLRGHGTIPEGAVGVPGAHH